MYCALSYAMKFVASFPHLCKIWMPKVVTCRSVRCESFGSLLELLFLNLHLPDPLSLGKMPFATSWCCCHQAFYHSLFGKGHFVQLHGFFTFPELSNIIFSLVECDTTAIDKDGQNITKCFKTVTCRYT